MNSYAGMKIVLNVHATRTIHLFTHRKRTKRGMRRLRAKYGTLYRTKPSAYKMGDVLVMHPALYVDLKSRSMIDVH